LLRWTVFVLVSASISGFVALLIINGMGEILRGVGAIGWGPGLVVLLRLTALSLAGLGWRRSMGARPIRAPATYIGLRLIRESINCLLPVGQVGGDMIGGRLLARFGVPQARAAASILVDLLLQATTQGLFAMLGLAVLWHLEGDSPLLRKIGGGLIVAVPALGGFFIAQRLGLFALVDKALREIARRRGGDGSIEAIDLQGALRGLYADPRSLFTAGCIHFAGWLTGMFEIFVVLRHFGGSPSLGEAMVLESLGQAVRSAAFAVPGALGVQEGGYILLGSLFMLSPCDALVISLVKRLPDLVIGVPGLLVWQAMEAAFLRRRRLATE
jgi:putative membrane protein